MLKISKLKFEQQPYNNIFKIILFDHQALLIIFTLVIFTVKLKFFYIENVLGRF